MTPVRTGPAAERSARPLRSDAVRNRERVLNAAETEFAAVGGKAQLDAIAALAGVGVGTVCRHFPSKQALLEAVLARRYESLLEAAVAALGEEDPATVLEGFVLVLVEFHGRHRALAEQMANELEVASLPVREELMRAVTELVACGQAVGAVRSDIGAADVSMLFSGVAHATSVVGDLSPVLRERYVRIVLDGLRPDGASTLPGTPLDFDELQRLKRRSRAQTPES